MVQFLYRLQHLLTISYVHLNIFGSKSIMRIIYRTLELQQSETNFQCSVKFCLTKVMSLPQVALL